MSRTGPFFLPEKDKDYHRMSELKDQMGSLNGGRIAEEMVSVRWMIERVD